MHLCPSWWLNTLLDNFMNNIAIYIETTEKGRVADVSLELCTKGYKLAQKLGVQVEAYVAGYELKDLEEQLCPYGVDKIFYANDKSLAPYRTLPHFAVVKGLIEREKPQIVLFGATCVGRDLAPRIASALRCGLTADCTSLEIGDHTDAKTGKEYKNLLYQIRPAFGGNIIATIVSPESHPQMATVREGVMKKEVVRETWLAASLQIVEVDCETTHASALQAVEVISREIVEQSIDIKGAQIIVAGGYGVGSKEGFDLLHKFADLIGAEVGASRAAVDAGFTESARQIGQTGVTVRPKLYIACGISGAVQHRCGMEQSGQIISINTDPEAPINSIADYTIIGDVNEVIPRLMKAYQENRK